MRCRHWVLLLILFSLALFLGGFRLGKKVERFDKTYLPLLTPTPTPKPTATPLPLRFNTFSSKDCGVKFLYPSFFKEEKNTTDEAVLSFQEEKILIDCSTKKIDQFNKDKEKLSKEKEEMILNQKIIIYQTPDENHYLFSLSNWQNGKRMIINVPKNLFDLLIETLKLL